MSSSYVSVPLADKSWKLPTRHTWSKEGWKDEGEGNTPKELVKPEPREDPLQRTKKRGERTRPESERYFGPLGQKSSLAS